MSVLADLLERHKASLSPEQKRAFREMVLRQQARLDFAAPAEVSALEAQTGYILIERVFTETPTHLFGQDVPSLAHSKISILRARTDASGDFVPGEVIFSARISEKSLTQAVLLSNRGEGHPMTTTRLGGYDLPARGRMTSKAQRSKDGYEGSADKRIGKAIAAFREHLTPELKRSNAGLRGATAELGYAERDLTSASFSLQRHLEEMSIIRSEIVTEAAHAALHADKVAAALRSTIPSLPASDPVDWGAVCSEHPMVDAALDPLSADAKAALGVLIAAEVERMAQDYPALLGWMGQGEHGPTVAFPEPRGISSALGWRSEDNGARGHIDRLASLWNWAFNPHIAAARPLYAADQTALSVTQRSGWLGNIHSSLPPTEGSCFALRFSAAWQESELGSIWLRTRSMPLVEIEIVAEDLMTALRGHPDGLPVPCSLRSVAGTDLGRVERPQHQLAADMAEIDSAVSSGPEVAALRQSIESLEALVASGRTGKAWREELEAGLARVEAAFRAATREVRDGVAHGRSHIDAHVAENTKAMLRSISRSLPAEIIDVLRIDKP